jgi:hypothetical protein
MSNLNKARIATGEDTMRSLRAQIDANNKTIVRMKEARQKALEEGDEASVKEWDE